MSKTEPGKEANHVAHQLCDAFEASRTDELTESQNGFVIEEDRQYEIQKPHWILIVWWLVYRNLLIVARDPSIQKCRIIQKIVSIKIHTGKRCKNVKKNVM